MILGIDAGSANGKVATREGVFAFDSCVGDGRERRLETDYPDMVQGVYQGKRFFAGVLAEKESYYPRNGIEQGTCRRETACINSNSSLFE